MTETTCIPVIVHGDKGQITEIPAGQLPADLPASVIDTLKVLGAISESAPPAEARQPGEPAPQKDRNRTKESS